MNKDWLAVFEALKAVYTEGAFSNMSVNEAVSRHRGCRESFVRTFAKGTVRDTIRLDYIIDSLASKGVSSIRPRPLIVLRMGLYAICSLGSVPDHAAVSEAVSLARAVAKGNDRFVNAILRSFLRRRDEFNEESMQPHVRLAFSEAVLSLLRDQYGDEAFRIAEALNEPPELYLRANALRINRDELILRLRSMGVEAEKSDVVDAAVRIKGSGVASDRMYREGMYSIQSLSSMRSVKALGPKPGSKVLDICAAPGGKTGYMAEIMRDEGEIIACDIHPHRVKLIEAAMKRIGATIAKAEMRDASVFDPGLEDKFDYVLADVPCSGLGVVAGKPEIKLRTDPEKYAELTELQGRILDNAVRYVKPGGRLCYSTCTLNKNENENVIKQLLSNTDSSLRIIEMNTLLPYNGEVGFYYCIIEKNAN